MCGSNAPVGLDLGEALRRERVGERAVDEADAVLELRLLVLRGGLERPLEVVEDGQQLLDEPLGRARDQVALLARGALAVVVELGLQAPERVEVLVALAPDGLELVEPPRPARRGRLRLGSALAARSGSELGSSLTRSWPSSSSTTS